MSFRSYPFAIEAGASYQFGTEAAEVVCTDANIDFEIGINGNTPDQFKKGFTYEAPPDDPIKHVVIKNPSANTTLIGRVTTSFGRVRDRRFVPVSRSDALDGKAFMKANSTGPVAAQNSHIELFNPAASPVNGLLLRLTVINNTGAAGSFNLKSHNAALATGPQDGANKLIGGAAPNLTTYVENSAAPIGTVMGSFRLRADESLLWTFAEPIVLTPGNGIILAAAAVNSAAVCQFEWVEP